MADVVIVGAGFTGTVVAARLLRSLRGPARVTLVDRTERFGRGIAYGTWCAEHVLNVPAGRMSALPEDQDHFLRWARERDGAVGGGSFVPRMVYGEYLGWVLDEAERGAAPEVALERVEDEAVGMDASGAGATVSFASGRKIQARRVVLAVGNFAPADPPGLNALAMGALYVRDPWSGDALRGVAPEEPLLLVGTGLTMIDVVLDLAARGHRATITAVSRRGLLPQPHRSPAVAYQPERPAGLDEWPRSALGMLKALRREVRAAADKGIDWREVVTALRADTPRLWASLPEREQRRFLERLRAFWDTHRHRSAPGPAAAIETMVRKGRLRVVAGRIMSARVDGQRARVEIRARGQSHPVMVESARVINCTGPETDLGRCRDRLISAMRDGGLIRPDPLGLGLLTTEDGLAIGRRGPAPWLTVAGPLRRAQLWENTAVPELRVEAAAAARRIGAELEAVAGRGDAPARSATDRL